MMYAFAKLDAVRSFREAWKRDPDCAICYWGEAWAWGSYLNGPMSAEQSPFAYAAAKKALALSDKATPKERRFIDALQVRYVKNFDVKTRVEQDKAYAEAMRKLYENASRRPRRRHALRRCAVPARAAARHARRQRAQHQAAARRARKRAGARSEASRARATSTCTRPSRPCGPTRPKRAPRSSATPSRARATSTTCRRTRSTKSAAGAIRCARTSQAWHSDQKAEHGEGFAIYPDHNLHMLLYAASMDGQGAIAMQAGTDYAQAHQRLDVPGADADALRPLRRSARGDQTARARGPGRRVGLRAGLRALCARSRTDFASVYLARVQKTAETSKAEFRSHPAKHLLGVLAGILEGEIARAADDLPGAIAAFERAVVADDALEYDEPEPLPFPARHWLGAALLEAKRPEDAERVYREDLKDHPHNGWSLLGLQQALKAQGKRRPRSMRISPRAGRDRTPGSARRASERQLPAVGLRRLHGLGTAIAVGMTADS